MQKKYNVLFVIPSLRAGGAERVMSFIAQNLDPNLFDTTLMVIGHSNDQSYAIKDVNVVFLEKSRVLNSFFSIFQYLKKNRPNIVISAIGHVNTLMALESIFFRNIVFIGREVNVISVLRKIQPSKRSYFPINLTKYSYKLLDIILCQSKDMAQDMQENFAVPEKKIRIINNPISTSFSPKPKYPENKVPKFITVGSLVERKGHKRMLSALSKFNAPFEYILIGDGNGAEAILRYAEEQGIRENISHIPFTNKVSDHLKMADVFLQGSYVEGFSNALLESCACGTPAVAFKAPGGIDEIIEDGVNGYIVENESEFVEKLHLLLQQKLNPEVVSSVVFERFNSLKILKKYEDLFLEVMQKQL